MSSTQKEITRYAKKQENVTRKEKKKKKAVSRTDPEITQMLELQKKDFKQKKDMSVEREILNRTETIMVGI